MMKRALLIGAPLAHSATHALAGVANDIDRAGEILRLYGFHCDDVLFGERATRDGIVARLEALIAETQADDAVVIYFSGHGGRVVNTGIVKDLPGGDYRPGAHQFLVPEDYQPKAQTFTGILDFELRYLVARLAARTENVSVILDCCHSGGAIRAPGRPTPKALDEKSLKPHTVHLNRVIRERLVQLRESLAASRAPRLTQDAHPHLVRIEAAHEFRLAYETRINNRQQGVLTAAWADTLWRYRGLAVSWQALASEIQARARAFVPMQYVHIDGPTERRLFSLAREPARHSLAIVQERDGTLWLDGGRFQGVASGARFAVLPPTSTESDIDSALAEVRAVEVMPERTRVELATAADDIPRWQGLHAWPLHARGAWTGVAVRAQTAAVCAALLRAIEASQRMHLCPDSDGPVATVIELSSDEGSRIAVLDGHGVCVSPPVATPERALALVERLQRAALVRMLGSGTDEHALPIPLALRLERADGIGGTCRHLAEGRTEPPSELLLASAGAQVHAIVENHGSAIATDTQDVYLTMFCIAADGRVERVSKQQSSGIRLCGGAKHRLEYELGAGGASLPEYRAADSSTSGYGLHSLIVVATDRQQELRNLETWSGEGSAAKLQPGVLDLTASKRAPARRGSASASGPLRYAVLRVDLRVAAAVAGRDAPTL
ncbi:caspase family protein [Haliangium ochraceum]|uniref:Peptidase C14 caspase catalytic subunit p20 n=1 Tax=Haliangium ochraceum (strain DSM 14365 / JCM 11303 / SMP-2) TaxID=502025 RepID=D0LTI6_HALO1|nr:caspase family protein [Haliangium ochraceum]ACY13881.1 peptidase C14 caspase catalytic subunit p20 [Haliangium ochraceum DSM 14365]